MSRCVVSVATGPYVKSLDRLLMTLQGLSENVVSWRDALPPDSPTHRDVPYAFKAHALKAAELRGYDTLLWADSIMVPIQPLDPLWEKIERDGYYLCNNGYTNYEWTADSAYPDLFPDIWQNQQMATASVWDLMRKQNMAIKHTVGGLMGISLKHTVGRAFLAEYFRLAQAKAFCGPWINETYARAKLPVIDLTGVIKSGRCAPCGPVDVQGHRHDQTAASVIAWRLGMELTDPPEFFAYRGGETEETIVVADGPA